MRCLYCHNPDSRELCGGKKTSAEALIAQAEEYRDFCGGITASGGEPMLQPEFVRELFALAKKRGFNTALDTSAQPYDPRDDKIAAMLETCDLVILDIKHIDPVKHKSLTGYGNDNILEFAKALAENGKPLWIRHVLVPGYESDDELRRLGEFIRGLKSVKKAEILPYHTLGRHKWKSPYPLEGVRAATGDDVERARKIMKI